MLKIRLQRVGRKNDPSFRLVVVDSRTGPKSGNHVEVLGSYNARAGSPVINKERALHWISVGAQLSSTVHNLFVAEKVIKGEKVNVLPKKSPIVKEKTEDEKSSADEGSTEEATSTEEKEEKEVTADEAPKETEPAPEPKKEESTPSDDGEEKPAKE